MQPAAGKGRSSFLFSHTPTTRLQRYGHSRQESFNFWGSTSSRPVRVAGHSWQRRIFRQIHRLKVLTLGQRRTAFASCCALPSVVPLSRSQGAHPFSNPGSANKPFPSPALRDPVRRRSPAPGLTLRKRRKVCGPLCSGLRTYLVGA